MQKNNLFNQIGIFTLHVLLLTIFSFSAHAHGDDEDTENNVKVSDTLAIDESNDVNVQEIKEEENVFIKPVEKNEIDKNIVKSSEKEESQSIDFNSIKTMSFSALLGILAYGLMIKKKDRFLQNSIDAALFSLIIVTAAVHIIVGLKDLLLLLNGLGYVFFSFLLAKGFNKFGLFIRSALIFYTLITIILYFYAHPWGYSHGVFDYLGVFTKINELFVIIFVLFSMKKVKDDRDILLTNSPGN